MLVLLSLTLDGYANTSRIVLENEVECGEEKVTFQANTIEIRQIPILCSVKFKGCHILKELKEPRLEFSIFSTIVPLYIQHCAWLI
ncbi:MAG: hypothetical protein MUE33_03565 [Cytophagaceae bacterium]|nr:hypothetical protein [Cytophagaceae bacterium]